MILTDTQYREIHLNLELWLDTREIKYRDQLLSNFIQHISRVPYGYLYNILENKSREFLIEFFTEKKIEINGPIKFSRSK